MLDPSIFMQSAITAKDVEDEKAIKLACNSELFERLDVLALNHELYISSSFMGMFLKITDEFKQLKGTNAFFVPIYALWRLFGTPIGKKRIDAGADPETERYAAICESQGNNVQAYIDVADKIRTAFKSKKLKQYAFRVNIGRGYQTVGPAMLKAVDAVYQPALAVKSSKASADCNPEMLEKIFEDAMDFIEFEGPLVSDNKRTFELLQGAGLPASTERKPNPDLIERDRVFLKDKFKGVKSRGFRYFTSKLNMAKFIMVDLTDPLLA